MSAPVIPARSFRLGLLWPLLLLPAAALAQSAPPAPETPTDKTGFESLWTGWSGASRESIRAEGQAGRPERGTPAGVRRHYQAGSIGLGERVGEVVREGDCEEGERLAREAGDFPLLEAVRTHCRPQTRSR